MKLFKKTYWLIYPVLIVVFMFVFDQIYKTDNFLLKAGISAFFAFVLSPRKKNNSNTNGKNKTNYLGFFKEANKYPLK